MAQYLKTWLRILVNWALRKTVTISIDDKGFLSPKEARDLGVVWEKLEGVVGKGWVAERHRWQKTAQ